MAWERLDNEAEMKGMAGLLHTRSVLVHNLRPHHIGREFVGLGTLQMVSIEGDGYHLVATGNRLIALPSLRLAYYLRDDEKW